MIPIINTFNQYIAGIDRLYRLVGELKSLRSRLELHGMPGLSNEQYVTLSGATELSHIDKGKVERLFAGMTALDTALSTPVPLVGVTMPPAKAMVDVLK